MLRKFTTSFDELIRNYYGDSGRAGVKDAVSLEELFANYYGKSSVVAEERKKKQRATAMSLPHDSGEVLVQRRRRRGPGYGYQQSTHEPGFEEYVVISDAVTPQTSAAMSVEPAKSEVPNVRDEYAVDILAPLQESPAASAKAAIDEQRQAAPAPAPPVPETPKREAAPEEIKAPKVSDDDIIGDLEAILKGDKVYDPHTKKTVEKNGLSGPQPAPNNLPAPNGDGQAIFDRIAQSMSYANKFDLGTVELENRFSDFDRMAELQERAAREKKQKPQYAQSYSVSPAPAVKNEDFIEDLDAIRNTHGNSLSLSTTESLSVAMEAEVNRQRQRDPACVPFTVPLSIPDYSHPLFDTGEHVLSGREVNVNQLNVGKAPGVMFTYGQLLAMGDFYDDDLQMMNADPSELRNLQSLIDQSTRYYAMNPSARKGSPHLNIDNEKWDKASGGRYLELAEKNYSHFSPNTIFTDAVALAANKEPNNKSTWEDYHERAIKEAQKMWLAPENQNRSFVPELPLIINGFGDHFLTDAFASGHIFNKEVMIAYFKEKFFLKGALRPASKKFFARVSNIAFGPWWKMTEVRKKFSVLETTDYPVCALGWCLKWHPNIDTEGMFETLLVKAAEQYPDRVANFAVKALHDHLNEIGLAVTNQAGNSWHLTGDGFLNTDSLTIMKRAVQQSVDNILDPSIRASNLNFGSYFDKVWRYVPELTPASKQKVVNLMNEYTKPESTVLSQAAADIITKQVDSVIKVLKDKNKLKDA